MGENLIHAASFARKGHKTRSGYLDSMYEVKKQLAGSTGIIHVPNYVTGIGFFSWRQLLLLLLLQRRVQMVHQCG